MKNLRTYGNAPHNIAVIHGGPGAPGEMAPVARELSTDWGVLEPLQTEASVEGQICELKGILDDNAYLPATLAGWSWGAWLGFIFSARFPRYVRKLILIGSGPFEEKYARNIMDIRLSRLTLEEKGEAWLLIKSLDDPSIEDKNILLARFGKLISKADSYDPLPHNDETVEYRYPVFQKVWEEASQLRRSGKLIEFGKKIQCPVTAIHGDYDPHPLEGVKRPLSHILKGFRFILLRKCGHCPWIEIHAKHRFYTLLKNEVGGSLSDSGPLSHTPSGG